MNHWARRALFTAAALGLSVVAGGLLGAWLNSPSSGLLVSAALGLAGVLLADSMRGARLLRWLRSGGEGAPPVEAGVWGELGAQVWRALQQRERATAAEADRLQQFLAAVEASPIGVLLLDADSRITWCSRAAAGHLDLQPQRDLQQHVTNLVRAPAFVEQLRSGAGEEPVVFSSAGGLRLASMVLPYGDGQRLVLTQDVTERERAEAMRRNFVANVSHEIRTPLTVLAGFVETMAQLNLSEPERKRVLALMQLQAQRMQSLVTDLLSLAQIEGSPRPPADRWIDLQPLMERARDDAMQLSAGRHDVRLDGGAGVQVAGDEGELLSALANLAVNAVRYAPAGGPIDIRWRWLDDGRGELAVIDAGIGIAREHLPHLTERFYRVDSSRSRDTGGTGLGLSIVKHVMQRHGGEIVIESEPGRGSTFRLRLPAFRLRARAEVGASARRQPQES